jgi:hypothetical protein
VIESIVELVGIELEALSGRERSGSPLPKSRSEARDLRRLDRRVFELM